MLFENPAAHKTSISASRSRQRIRIYLQIFLVLLPFALFFDVALATRGRLNLSVFGAAALCFVLNGATLFFLFLFLTHLRKESRTRHATTTCRNARRTLASYLPIAAVELLYGILSLFSIDRLALYDGAMCYSALLRSLDTFIYTPFSFMTSFNLETHPMQGSMLFVAVGEMLFPRECIGVNLVILLLSMLAVFLLSEIFRRLIPDAPNFVHAAGAGLFAFSPWVLGLTGYLNPDYLVIVFFIFLMYCYLRDLPILTAFTAILVCFSKETGFIYVIAFLGIAEAYYAIVRKMRDPSRSLFSFPHWRRVLPAVSAPLLILLYYKTWGTLGFAVEVTHQSPLRWNSKGFHCFGISLQYIGMRLSQFLLANWGSIAIFLSLMAMITYLLRSRHSHASRRPNVDADASSIIPFDDRLEAQSVSAGLIASGLSFLLFSCLFITNPCPRYAVGIVPLLAYIIIRSLLTITRDRRLLGVTLSVILTLNIVQNYMTIDPWILLRMPSLNLGYQQIYSPTGHEYDFVLECVGDYFTYNSSFYYSQDLVDQALSEINLQKDDTLVFLNVDWYEMFFADHSANQYEPIYWDPDLHCRTYSPDGANRFIPKYILVGEQQMADPTLADLPDNFYFLLTARESEDRVLAFEKAGYRLTSSFTASNFWGYIRVYHMEKAQ